jgi:uncharacterized damage-inducible protein DinB
MNIKLTELFLADLEREAKGTRRALERIPDGRGDWKPHDKSMDLTTLSTMLSGMPGWVAMMIDLEELEIGHADDSSRKAAPATSAALVKAHEDALNKAREALARTNDEHLMKNWKLLVHGKVVAEDPRHVMIRDTIGHLAHHRGQLTVYLRLLDVPVPAIYGPSADDKRFD